MSNANVTRSINAPAAAVFHCVADIENFAQAIERITAVEFLSEQKIGVGTRFRETRVTDGREVTNELEVTEYVEGERVRIVTDTHGTLWDTVFTVDESGTVTELTLVMDARPYQLVSRLMVPLVMRAVCMGLTADMDAVKSYCEGHPAT